MVKYALLGILSQRPRHGYELKGALDEALRGVPPVNAGQIYTTLGRLERDRLVAAEVVAQDVRPDRRVFSVTEDGRAELKQWLAEPVPTPIPLKDELFLKVLVLGLLGGPAVDVLWRQRDEHLRSLAELTRLRRDRTISPITALLLDGAILHVEADLTWLELCEETLGRRSRRHRP